MDDLEQLAMAARRSAPAPRTRRPSGSNVGVWICLGVAGGVGCILFVAVLMAVVRSRTVPPKAAESRPFHRSQDSLLMDQFTSAFPPDVSYAITENDVETVQYARYKWVGMDVAFLRDDEREGRPWVFAVGMDTASQQPLSESETCSRLDQLTKKMAAAGALSSFSRLPAEQRERILRPKTVHVNGYWRGGHWVHGYDRSH